MKERPILFSAPMVRAILDGSKTQTRRALRVQPLDVVPMNGDQAGREWVGLMTRDSEPKGTVFRCKFGQPGDRLWVRETWAFNPDHPGQHSRAIYRADPECKYDAERWTPSIHMPRAASRILLEITSVRVERLQDISDYDAIAEGIGLNATAVGVPMTTPAGETMPRVMYRDLWQGINGPGSWDANPWVWVVEFKRVQA
jgi:hypothetical protein